MVEANDALIKATNGEISRDKVAEGLGSLWGIYQNVDKGRLAVKAVDDAQRKKDEDAEKEREKAIAAGFSTASSQPNDLGGLKAQ